MPSKIRHNHKNLNIWNLGIEIVDDCFTLINEFPVDEKFGLSSQNSRSSISAPSNIAEGPSRTDKSFSHFIDISLGSSFELQTQLLIAFNRNYSNKGQLTKIEEKLKEFQKWQGVYKINSEVSSLNPIFSIQKINK